MYGKCTCTFVLCQHIYEMSVCILIFSSNLKTFEFYNVYFEREIECWRNRERGRERESQAGSTPSVQSSMRGSSTWTVRSWPEPKLRVRGLSDWATRASLALHFIVSFPKCFWKKQENLTRCGVKCMPCSLSFAISSLEASHPRHPLCLWSLENYLKHPFTTMNK